MSTTAVTKLAIKPIASPDRNPHTVRHLRVIDSGKAKQPRYQQAALALEFASPRSASISAKSSAFIRLVHSSTWHPVLPEDKFFERQPTGTSELPPAEPWAQRFAQVVSEVMGGQRSPKQVARWVTPSVMAQLQPRRLSGRSARNVPPSVVKRIRVDQPADGVAEVAAVVRDKNRARALALRLEGWDGRWICTSAQWVG